jgi:2-oxoglutarate ferredoxin oxidoreductase subunit gamma
MTHEIIMAGFGGQGVMLLGKILATAAMIDGKETTWLSSYGPEMRGGTANCSVVVSDKSIGSPYVAEPTAAVVLNSPSFEKFEPLVKSGGILIVNSSLIELRSARTDIRSFLVPCTDITVELGNPRGTNLVALGALLAATSAVSREAATKAIAKNFEGKSISVSSLDQLVQRGFDAVSKGAGAVKAGLVSA